MSAASLIPAKLLFHGRHHSTDYSYQVSDMYIDSSFVGQHVITFPRFYGKGGILECALLGKKQPDTIEQYYVNRTMSLAEAKVFAEKHNLGYEDAAYRHSEDDTVTLYASSWEVFVAYMKNERGLDITQTAEEEE